MTFEEWQSTRKLVKSINDELGTTCGEGPGYCYKGDCFIELNRAHPPGENTERYCLTIENWSALSSDLPHLERELWERWARGEIALASSS